MRIRVLLFARLRELAGGGESLEVDVPEGTTLGALWKQIQETCPPLRACTSSPLMARNLEYVSPETTLTGGEEVAFLPPVSGG
jgi:molybdopterin converting factor subunit 1